MNDYERVAQIIRRLDDRQGDQPALEELARAAGLSGSRLHRLFVKWVGITPKDFLQCLTLGHAREALKRGRSVMDAAFDSGLSGPGRLHDLCVTLEAATPGEVKSGGEGMRIIHGFGRTPFGEALVANSPRGVCHLTFTDEAARASAVDALAGQIAQNAPLSVRAMKAFVQRAASLRRELPRDDLEEMHRQIRASADLVEGLEARAQKRRPRFRGA